MRISKVLDTKFFVLIVGLMLMLVPGGFATFVSGNDISLSDSDSFNFSSGQVIAGTGGHFTWNGTVVLQGPPTNLVNEQAVYGLNSWVVEGFGPNRNISQICQVFGTPFRSAFPIYQVNDGVSLYNSQSGEYAVIVITQIIPGVGGSNITFSYRANVDTNVNNTIGTCPTTGCFANANRTACEAAVQSGQDCRLDFGANSCFEGRSGGSGDGGAGSPPNNFVDCFPFGNNQNACRSEE